MSPEVSVIVPTYNREHLLKETIDSILNQTLRDFELIIIDNYSTDNTEKLVKSYKDNRIRYFKNLNNGIIAVNRNFGIKKAKGEFIAICDDDDISLPMRLEKEVNVILNSNPNIAVVGSWMQVIDRNNQPSGIWKGYIGSYPDFLFSILEETTPLYQPTVMFRKDAFMKVGGYHVNFNYAEDFNLWACLALAGYHAKIIPEPLCYYRVHEGQHSVTKKQIQRQNSIKTQERMIRYFSDAFPAKPIRLFFENEDSFWQEISNPKMMKDLIRALQQVHANMQAKLNMNPEESTRLKQLFYTRAGMVALRGAILSYRKTSRPLYLFALKGGFPIFKNCAILYPFFYLPSFITSPLRRIFWLINAKIRGWRGDSI